MWIRRRSKHVPADWVARYAVAIASVAVASLVSVWLNKAAVRGTRAPAWL
jgi:hypothetical protein